MAKNCRSTCTIFVKGRLRFSTLILVVACSLSDRLGVLLCFFFSRIGTHQGTCYSDNVRFCNTFLPKNLSPQHDAWNSEFKRHEVGTKRPQFSMLHRLLCSCNLSPLQYRIETNQLHFVHTTLR